uniref:Uncharacterized protein n=1 Tax=Arundo donax TaxID=35708 RepID=A0A0A9G3I7_ARUDO
MLQGAFILYVQCMKYTQRWVRRWRTLEEQDKRQKDG